MSKSPVNKQGRTVDQKQSFKTWRASCSSQSAHGFDGSLDTLGNPIAGDVLAEIQSFMRDWNDGVSDSELAVTWEYKPLHVPKKDSKYRTKQIRVLTNYRVALVVLPSIPCVCFLHAYRRKGNTNKNVDIPLARARAKAVWKE